MADWSRRIPPGEDRFSRELADLRAEIREQVAQATHSLVGTVAYLSSLVSEDAWLPGFNTGTLPANNLWTPVGPVFRIDGLHVPTGRIRVTLNCEEASVDPGGRTLIAGVFWGIEGTLSPLIPGQRGPRLYTPAVRLGASLSSVQTAYGMDQEREHSIVAQCACWVADVGSGNASVNYASTLMTVEVIPPFRPETT